MSDTSADRIKRGYLDEDFRLFHIRDKRDMEFEFHYHEFNKIIILISGSVTYMIEGKAYKLKPYDFVFVCKNDIHRVMVSASEPYERIVLWINSKFLERFSEDVNLLTCFELSSKHRNNLLRIDSEALKVTKPTIFLLEKTMREKEFGSKVLANSLFLQLMVYLNRLYIGSKVALTEQDIVYDSQILNIIDYINKNLYDELSLEGLSAKFFISKYYLMHKFKLQTGYTVHNYILQKRLMKASSLIKNGMPISEVYIKTGFGDYSNFIRTFKKEFGLSPKKYCKIMTELENS